MLKNPYNCFGKKKPDNQGSEALEFLGTFWWLILIAMALVLLFAYVFRVGQLNYICKRAVHSVEISGVYDASKVQNLADTLYCDDIPISINCYKTSNSTGVATASLSSGNIVQYKDTFVIEMTTSYTPLIFKTHTAYPVKAVVHGVSEVYTEPASSETNP